MKMGQLLDFKRPQAKNEPETDYSERLVELSIALHNGEITLQDLQEEVEGWR
jgi:hypothetical protein